MKIEREDGVTTISTKWLDIDLYCEWAQLLNLKRWNWVEFHLFDFKFEVDHIVGESEVVFYLFGFGIRFYWINNKSKLRRFLEKWEK